MKISKFLVEAFVRDPLLYRVGLAMIIMSGLLVMPLAVDDRLVLGINPWIKPIKFCLSASIYVFTIAWFLHYIKSYSRIKKWISYLTGITIIIDILIITFQAFRGLQSHFNYTTYFDQILFGIMGLCIGISTLMIVIYFLILFIGKSSISLPYRLSILLSIFIFLVGSWVGGVMISIGSHTIGAEDGSFGILFFNWSREFGDLRIAHFLGLHAIQIIPMCYYFFIAKVNNVKLEYLLITIVSLIYSTAIAFLFHQAQLSEPLFPQ